MRIRRSIACWRRKASLKILRVKADKNVPFLQLADYRIYYELTGSPSAAVLVLANSLGTTMSMWDPQLAEFEKEFQVLRYDTRGHGQSEVTPGPYTFGQLAQDVVRLLDALKIEQAHFCGLSMGGLTGLQLGLDASGRFRKMVISSASAKFGTAEGWDKRIAAVGTGGMTLVAGQVVERWFTKEFRETAPRQVEAMRRMIEAISPEGYVHCCMALRDADLREELSRVETETMIISGTQDPVSPPADGQLLASRIPGARYCELHASHLSNVEAAEEFTRAALSFLAGSGGGNG
jgi:3-oxoadipate enol-lactonase